MERPMSRFVVLSLCAAVVLLGCSAGTSAEDVVVLTPVNFDLEVGQSKDAWVEFYTSWELAPEWEMLGTRFKEGKNVLIGKVNCDQQKSLCTRYGISKFPTISWFPAGSQVPEVFLSLSDIGTVELLKEFVNGYTLEAEAEFRKSKARTRAKWSSPPSDVFELTPAKLSSLPSDVVELTPANFYSVVFDETKDVLVNFYAPWCIYSQHLAPVYEEVAAAFKNESGVVVAKCDAAGHHRIARRFHVNGFPTILFFPKNEKKKVQYHGDRVAVDFVDFLNKQAGTRVKLSTPPSDVVVLTPDNFDSVVLDKTKDVLVKFYSTWCDSCKSLGPVYEEVAAAFKEESGVVVAKYDIGHMGLRKRYGVSEYPTIKFFPKNNKEGVEYDGGPDVSCFIDFLNKQAGTRRTASGGRPCSSSPGYRRSNLKAYSLRRAIAR